MPFLWLLIGGLLLVGAGAIVMAIREDRRKNAAKGVDWLGRVFPPPDEP